jgi:hypothetical protein
MRLILFIVSNLASLGVAILGYVGRDGGVVSVAVIAFGVLAILSNVGFFMINLRESRSLKNAANFVLLSSST